MNNKIDLLNKLNSVKKKYPINCIYGLDNKQFNNYIKIGSTNYPERRKFDYQTSSPYPYRYLWIFYLKDYDAKLIDDLIKRELSHYNVKNIDNNDKVGIEFYRVNTHSIVEDVLKKYHIEYELEIGDKYVDKKIDNNENSIKQLKMERFAELFSQEEMNDMLKNNIISKIQKLKNNLCGDTSLDRTINIKIEQLENELKELDGNTESQYDITDSRYQYVLDRLDEVDYNELEDLESQSLNFFIDKIKKKIKNIIILGLIQSGKTKEIISILHFCVNFLRIPVVIIIQNKTSGYYQMEKRINEFSDELEYYNIYCKYVKTGLNKKNSKNIFNPNDPKPGVYIGLSNYLQMNKLKDNIENAYIHHRNKMCPYVLIMDEYDDLIKSRQDMDVVDRRKVEASTKYLKENSFINVGVTATFLACMLTDEKVTLDDIYQLKPKTNYVGFGHKKIKVIDIKDRIDPIKNKRELHLGQIEYLIQQIDFSVDGITKPYSITLVNVSDKDSDHQNIIDLVQNKFSEWSGIVFNSKYKDSKIYCTLPLPEFSDREIIVGNTILEGKIINIVEKNICLPTNYEEYLDKEHMNFSRYIIEFEKFSISEIITELMTYTNKICIISGRMACRGISFVNDNYTKHITDMIYVPSGTSHLTRNVQDMRIYGNFPDDNLDINLYIDEDMYLSDIGGYIKLQNNLLRGNLDYEIQGKSEISCKQAIMNYEFNPENIPRKKLDRIGLVKGFKFKQEDKWGIPTNIKNLELCLEKISLKFKDYDIKIYSKYKRLILPEGEKFKIPTKENKLSRYYKNKFLTEYDIDLIDIWNGYYGNNITYIMNNYRNGWPLYNPMSNTRESIDLCYLGVENGNYIDVILKNPSIDREYLENIIGTKTIIIFYSREGYHYTKLDKKSSFIRDNLL